MIGRVSQNLQALPLHNDHRIRSHKIRSVFVSGAVNLLNLRAQISCNQMREFTTEVHQYNRYKRFLKIKTQI